MLQHLLHVHNAGFHQSGGDSPEQQDLRMLGLLRESPCDRYRCGNSDLAAQFVFPRPCNLTTGNE
jgi:hypothetical protein